MSDRPTHPYQISILRELLFKPNARFRDLKKMDIPNDHFTFHLKSLIETGLVEKTSAGYSLTLIGKQVSNLIDTDGNKYEKQGKIGIALHAIRYTNGQLETLVHQRLKHPYYGWWGSHSGKIRWGESPLGCAQREFEEETGLTGTFELKEICHYVDTHTNGTLLEDKYFFVFIITNAKGDLKETVEEGRNKWVGEQEYKSFPQTFGTWEGIIREVDAKELFYQEHRKTVSEY